MLKKFLIPHKDNRYRPHVFRLAGIAVLASVLAVGTGIAVFQQTLLSRTDMLAAVASSAMIDVTNQDRGSLGLTPLRTSALLTRAAQEKADDMAAKGYFAHVSPEGLTPWHWMSDVGYQYVFAGENLAVNFDDSAQVVQAWMNSPTHRANIVSQNFSEIGIATARGMYLGQESTFVVQMFARPVNPQNAAAAGAAPLAVFLTSPSTLVDNILIFLAAMILISLVSIVIIEAGRSNTRGMLIGVAMLLVVVGLYFTYGSFIFTGGIVGP